MPSDVRLPLPDDHDLWGLDRGSHASVYSVLGTLRMRSNATGGRRYFVPTTRLRATVFISGLPKVILAPWNQGRLITVDG